jgi:hypothetical protein
MPLGIFPGFLAGAGQGLVEQQKLRQQQQEAAIRNLLLQRSLKKDELEAQAATAGAGLDFMPGLSPIAPAGGTTSPSPALDLFGTGNLPGADPGAAPINYGVGGALKFPARGADTGYGAISTLGTVPALPPNTTNYFETSGPGYPVNPTPLAIPANARQAAGPNDNAVMQLNLGRAAAPAVAPAASEPVSWSEGGSPDTVLPPDAGSSSSMPPGAAGRPGVIPASYSPGAGDDAAPQQQGAPRPGETQVAEAQMLDPQNYARQQLGELRNRINQLPVSPEVKAKIWQNKLKEAVPYLKQYETEWRQQQQLRQSEERQQRAFQQQQQQQQRQFSESEQRQQRAFQQQQEQQRRQFEQQEKATQERERFTQESQGWSLEHDPVTNKDYRYNVRTGKSTTLTGEPYTPQGAVKPGTQGHGATLHNIEITDADGKASPPFAARPSADSPSGFVKSDGTPVIIPEGGSLRMTGVGGQGRQAAAQIQSMIGASSELVGEARNLMELPSTATGGIFQGLQNVPATELGAALKRTLANKLSPEEATDVKTSFQGVARSLATIEAQGRATGLVGLTGMSEQLMPQAGDSQGNVLRKMATLRQIMERNIDAIAASPNASKEQKDFLTKIRAEMEEVIPFTVSDVNKLQHGDKESVAQAAKKFGLGKSKEERGEGEKPEVGKIITGPDGKKYRIKTLTPDGQPDDVEPAQ